MISSSPTTPPSLENENASNNEHLSVSKISENHEDATKESVLLCSARSFMWPDESSLVMEVRVARSVLESELLVQEDEEVGTMLRRTARDLQQRGQGGHCKKQSDWSRNLGQLISLRILALLLEIESTHNPIYLIEDKYI